MHRPIETAALIGNWEPATWAKASVLLMTLWGYNAQKRQPGRDSREAIGMFLRTTITRIIGTVLVLCSGPALLAAAPLPMDACTLLTLDQISTTLDAKLVAGEHIAPNNTQLCGWSEPGGATIANKRVTLSITNPQRFEIGKTPIKGIDKTPVSGIGDDAFYTTASGLGTTLSVKKGNFCFNLSVKGNLPLDKVKAMEKTLAEDALAKL